MTGRAARNHRLLSPTLVHAIASAPADGARARVPATPTPAPAPVPSQQP